MTDSRSTSLAVEPRCSPTSLIGSIGCATKFSTSLYSAIHCSTLFWGIYLNCICKFEDPILHFGSPLIPQHKAAYRIALNKLLLDHEEGDAENLGHLYQWSVGVSLGFGAGEGHCDLKENIFCGELKWGARRKEQEGGENNGGKKCNRKSFLLPPSSLFFSFTIIEI